ncbi:MAG: TatD family hydrolase [Methylobacillus glycogenes]|nr:TatD family hydrolase [Methylobacillus glycogenes]
MLIDTHCHLDASEFDADRADVAQSAWDAGVRAIVVPGVMRANFTDVLALSQQHAHCAMALGIHPLFVDQSQPEDIQHLAQWLRANAEGKLPPGIQDESAVGKTPRIVAVGEIGLDFFVEGYDQAKQEFYFIEQLKLAREFDLPVLLHVRRSVDQVIKQVRRFGVKGIAHAYNGSMQQAEALIKLGFKLGFGGAMTWERALKLRSLARELPLEAIVLETDAPDISPQWLGHHGRNSPDQLPKIAEVLAELRGVETAEIACATSKNALDILPFLSELYTPANVSH